MRNSSFHTNTMVSISKFSWNSLYSIDERVELTTLSESDSVVNSTLSSMETFDFWQFDFPHYTTGHCWIDRHGSRTLRPGEAKSLLNMASVNHKTSARHSRAICDANKIVVNRLFDRR